jgi:antitoxin VapB
MRRPARFTVGSHKGEIVLVKVVLSGIHQRDAFLVTGPDYGPLASLRSVGQHVRIFPNFDLALNLLRRSRMVEKLKISTKEAAMGHLNIKNDRAHQVARRLAELTGESMTEAVTTALEERLEREKAKRNRAGVAERLMAIGRRSAKRPVLDHRSPEDIIGYDEQGLPS